MFSDLHLGEMYMRLYFVSVYLLDTYGTQTGYAALYEEEEENQKDVPTTTVPSVRTLISSF
jgi:hypothetical protein